MKDIILASASGIRLKILKDFGFNVKVVGVGERTREGNDLYHEMIESGVIKVNQCRRFQK